MALTRVLYPDGVRDALARISKGTNNFKGDARGT